MNSNPRLYHLFGQQLLHENSAQEKQELLLLMADPENLDLVGDLMRKYWEEFDVSDAHVEPIFQPGQGQEILNNLLDKHVHPVQTKAKKIKLWPRIAVAAAAVAAITLGTWLYTSRHPEGSAATRDLLVNYIKPGSVGATLTLSNGKTIKLSSATNGELAKEAGVTITKSEDGQLIYDLSMVGTAKDLGPTGPGTINTLSTAKGETYQVKLPDGTAVWLNAASRLTYATNLNRQGQRRVTLEGEAYFQVAKNKAHPFIVESKGQQVEVLGTHFNINAYPDEASTKTTLLEGSVKINDATILKPNQQATNTGTAIKVIPADADDVAWKDGLFNFANEDIKTVMRKVARWYNVEVRFEGNVAHKGIGGLISRYEQVSQVLNMINSTKAVNCRLEGRTIVVRPYQRD